MNVTIKSLYEMDDDLQEIELSASEYCIQYREVYPQKYVFRQIVHHGYILRSHTFYEVKLSHIPSGKDFILLSKLSASGIIYNYNKKTQQLFLYNTTGNRVYIQENETIGEILDG